MNALGVEEDTQSIPVIRGAEDRPHARSRTREPDGHSVAKHRRTRPVDAKLNLHLEGIWREGETGPEPAGLGGAVLGESDVFTLRSIWSGRALK